MKDYFFCYNKKVADYMYTQDIHYITVAKDVKSGRVFSLFEITPEFQKAMDKYNSK